VDFLALCSVLCTVNTAAVVTVSVNDLTFSLKTLIHRLFKILLSEMRDPFCKLHEIQWNAKE